MAPSRPVPRDEHESMDNRGYCKHCIKDLFPGAVILDVGCVCRCGFLIQIEVRLVWSVHDAVGGEGI